MARDKKGTIKCPICDEVREFEIHPNKLGYEIAYCNCRGSKVAVVEKRVVKVTWVSEDKIEEGD